VGIGAVGTFLVSVVIRREPTDLPNVLAMSALVAAIVAVKLTAPH
jgi:multidrug transporter EmrE-like cation transporter